jgi:hypothetical protein
MASISGEAKLLAPEVGVPSFDICTYCEEVVNYAKILLGSPDAEAQIKALLMGESKGVEDCRYGRGPHAGCVCVCDIHIFPCQELRAFTLMP